MKTCPQLVDRGWRGWVVCGKPTPCPEHFVAQVEADLSQDDSSLFAEPTSPLVGDAIKLHESFKALLQAGFTERQACYVLGAMIAAHSPEETS